MTAETFRRQLAALDPDSRSVLDSALDDGRIAWRELAGWVRALSSDAEAASGILESREPNRERRLENHRIAATARPSDLDDKLVAAFEADLASRLGTKVEELI